MAKDKIFVSYDYDNDSRYKNLLIAWDKNEQFDFEIHDLSVDVSIDSTDADYIKGVIKEKMEDADYVLCLIGEETYQSDWVAWELEKAVDLGKKLVAVKIQKDYISPDAILGVGAAWATSFTFESIKKAIEEA